MWSPFEREDSKTVWMGEGFSRENIKDIHWGNSSLNENSADKLYYEHCWKILLFLIAIVCNHNFCVPRQLNQYGLSHCNFNDASKSNGMLFKSGWASGWFTRPCSIYEENKRFLECWWVLKRSDLTSLRGKYSHLNQRKFQLGHWIKQARGYSISAYSKRHRLIDQ